MLYVIWSSNTYRIFDGKIPDRLDPDKVYKFHSYPKRDPKEYDQLKIHNTPQMYNAKFIRTNVRFMNAPISHMETESTMAEQCHWWPNTSYHDVSTQAPYRKDSTQRKDYQAIQQTHALVRHGRNNNRVPASGIIPILSPIGSPKVLLEHMSFIHQYDSRKLQHQPYQGRRHGALVWSEAGPRSPGVESTYLNAEGSCSAAVRGGSGGKEVTSPQQQVFNDGRIHSGEAGPRAKGPKAIARHSPTHPSSQLFHSFYTPVTRREQFIPQGGVEGISSVSDRAAEGRRPMHADGEATALQRQGSNSQQCGFSQSLPALVAQPVVCPLRTLKAVKFVAYYLIGLHQKPLMRKCIQ
ncbi:hypothetical protein J4Q44_G00282920 [Coregonus suidteri]|uniref:Uncharacterized protein n=1 Tax=Coregonus suidteri TaxID=861788 RepID=A0AAN8L397_9TELE